MAAATIKTDRPGAFWLKVGCYWRRKPPKVAVCGQRYVFNPVLADNELDPRAPCPLGIESTPVAGAGQSPQLAPAVANQSDLMAYQNDDPIARKIEESFRGVH